MNRPSMLGKVGYSPYLNVAVFRHGLLVTGYVCAGSEVQRTLVGLTKSGVLRRGKRIILLARRNNLIARKTSEGKS